ncbi:hypothetical protein ACFWDI_20030 [Streptomyces sp. NPDC060064]|uniref:hypothetical protein n=1 Tax=Streptomyces sp. NPDC060064 TaxID=3347049 RepID=UPI0036C0438A
MLADFARTGGVGVLKPGALLDDVSGILGPPVAADCFPNARKSWPRTFRYGELRLEVCRCRVIEVVALSTWTESVEIPAADGAVSAVVPTITFADVKEVFASAGARWELNEFPAVRSQFAALVELDPVGVRFTFHVPDTGATDQGGATLHTAISRSFGHVCGSGA